MSVMQEGGTVLEYHCEEGAALNSYVLTAHYPTPFTPTYPYTNTSPSLSLYLSAPFHLPLRPNKPLSPSPPPKQTPLN